MKHMYTVAEVASMFRVSETTVRRWLADGRLPAVQPGGPGGAVRFSAAVVESALHAGDGGATDPGPTAQGSRAGVPAPPRWSVGSPGWRRLEDRAYDGRA